MNIERSLCSLQARILSLEDHLSRFSSCSQKQSRSTNAFCVADEIVEDRCNSAKDFSPEMSLSVHIPLIKKLKNVPQMLQQLCSSVQSMTQTEDQIMNVQADIRDLREHQHKTLQHHKLKLKNQLKKQSQEIQACFASTLKRIEREIQSLSDQSYQVANQDRLEQQIYNIQGMLGAIAYKKHNTNNFPLHERLVSLKEEYLQIISYKKEIQKTIYDQDHKLFLDKNSQIHYKKRRMEDRIQTLLKKIDGGKRVAKRQQAIDIIRELQMLQKTLLDEPK